MATVCPHAAAAGATGAARPARRARRRSLCRQCDASAGGKALGPDAHTPRVACGFPAGGIVVALCGRGGCEGGVEGGPRRLLVPLGVTTVHPFRPHVGAAAAATVPLPPVSAMDGCLGGVDACLCRSRR